jgi:hypothetical protein
MPKRKREPVKSVECEITGFSPYPDIQFRNVVPRANERVQHSWVLLPAQNAAGTAEDIPNKIKAIAIHCMLQATFRGLQSASDRAFQDTSLGCAGVIDEIAKTAARVFRNPQLPDGTANKTCFEIKMHNIRREAQCMPQLSLNVQNLVDLFALFARVDFAENMPFCNIRGDSVAKYIREVLNTLEGVRGITLDGMSTHGLIRVRIESGAIYVEINPVLGNAFVKLS